MNFNLTDEQQALKDTVTKFIERDYSFEQRWSILRSSTGWSRTHWNALAEIGLMALPISEANGGLGGTGIDTGLVMEALGRGLVLEPYLGCALIPAALLQALGTSFDYEALATGETIYAFAHTEPNQRFERGAVALRAVKTASGYSLSGNKIVVLGGDCADVLLVSAVVDGDAVPSVFAVPATAPGVTRLAYPLQDAQRGADIAFKAVELPADALLGERAKAESAIDYALDVACAALCAEAVGAMSAIHAETIEYIKTRKQFGRAIGTNQALQHRAVDMLMQIELSRSMAIEAAVAVSDTTLPAAARNKAVSAAKTLVSQSCRFVGQSAVQLHGGIGVTDELNVSHYFKRLTMISLLFGDADFHLARYGDALLVA